MFRQQEGDIIKLQMKGIRINPFIFYKPFTGKQFKTHVQIQASLNTLVMILSKITLVTIPQLHHKLLKSLYFLSAFQDDFGTSITITVPWC